jgi:subtilisin family serine protease
MHTASSVSPRRQRSGLHRIATLASVGLLLPLAVLALPSTAFASGSERVTFVVVLKDGVEPRGASQDLARQHHGEVGFVYEHALRGFAITVAEQGAAGIGRDRRVASIERDQLFTTTEQAIPTGIKRTFASGNANLDIDGIDDTRVDVDIAIIDTGLDSDHPDLNIAGGTNCTGGGPFRQKCTDGSYEDGNGHGTHVGGSAAALDNGVGVVGMAPGARLHGVKVLGDNGSGYTSWIIAGIDWVTARASTIEVANMSLGCECSSTAQDTAIANSVAAGVTYAVAAGNSAKDASTFSPANHPDVITVSALADFNGLAGGGAAQTCRSDVDDTLADFSNFGASVEIAAPGVCILSTWPGGGYNTISGTSMASPHVAGAAAVLASSRPNATPDAIEGLLVTEGNTNWTDNSDDGVKEPLLDVSDTSVFAPAMVGDDSGGGEPVNAAPTAVFTQTCTDLTCAFDGSGSSDREGTISSYSWSFGDDAAATGEKTSHTYADGGTYTVTLTVTDNAGATGSSSQSVTVSSGSTEGISLTATGYKVKGLQKADLTWSGASSNVDIFRNGSKIINTVNDGEYTDHIDNKGSGSYTYKLCESPEPGTTTICSNEVTVVF